MVSVLLIMLMEMIVTSVQAYKQHMTFCVKPANVNSWLSIHMLSSQRLSRQSNTFSSGSRCMTTHLVFPLAHRFQAFQSTVNP